MKNMKSMTTLFHLMKNHQLCMGLLQHPAIQLQLQQSLLQDTCHLQAVEPGLEENKTSLQEDQHQRVSQGKESCSLILDLCHLHLVEMVEAVAMEEEMVVEMAEAMEMVVVEAMEEEEELVE